MTLARAGTVPTHPKGVNHALVGQQAPIQVRPVAEVRVVTLLRAHLQHVLQQPIVALRHLKEDFHRGHQDLQLHLWGGGGTVAWFAILGRGVASFGLSAFFDRRFLHIGIFFPDVRGIFCGKNFLVLPDMCQMENVNIFYNSGSNNNKRLQQLGLSKGQYNTPS